MPSRTILNNLRSILLIAIAILVSDISVGVPKAHAEGLLEGFSIRDLFSPRRKERRPVEQDQIPQRRIIDNYSNAPRIIRPPRKEPTPRPIKKRTVAPKPAQTIANPAPAPIEKQADAKSILVIGDFLAGGLADGLNAQFADDPKIRIIDRSNGSSGLVRDDYYNWPNELPKILDAEKPSLVIIMLGSNDRQQMTNGNVILVPRSPSWMAEYEKRIETLAELVKKADIPLIWVGMPPFKQQLFSRDMINYNDLYKAAAARNGADFIDIWDGFADENGVFITTGPDINGQPARLRGTDGINLTSAGKRKIAFYTEKALHRILGDATLPDSASLAPAGTEGGVSLPGASEHPEQAVPQRITRTVPIALDDPELDGGTELLGEAPLLPHGTLSSTQPIYQAGRADDSGGRSPIAEMQGPALPPEIAKQSSAATGSIAP